MKVIGITGPTGAGKTTLLREVECQGGAVIDCDSVYHKMLEGDIALQQKLEEAFGPLRNGSGGIDRKKLGEIVFRDPAKLERLNGIAWQAVADRVCALLEEERDRGTTLAAVDAIGLLESPLGKLCQRTVAVLAPAELRVKRIMAREGISEVYAWARVRSQKPDEYFSQHCDDTLVNDCFSAEEFAQKARKYLKEVFCHE